MLLIYYTLNIYIYKNTHTYTCTYSFFCYVADIDVQKSQLIRIIQCPLSPSLSSCASIHIYSQIKQQPLPRHTNTFIQIEKEKTLEAN